jgi:hypothetical protein
MFYRLLGMAVWKGGKLFVRRKYGSTARSPKVLAFLGTGVALAVAAAVFAARGGSED